jgi:dTDP-4-amino-4,6-dideoxygalactose transaminase
LLDGPHIGEYERQLSEYYGGLEAITFGAGRMALYAILKAMNLRDGDEIILPGYTCVVTSNAIRFAGLKPVYVDVLREDANMTPELVEKALTPRTRAILAQHTFGIACNLPALMDISRRHGVPIIEDCAHAIGARWDEQLLGRFGIAAFFSTEGSKMFSTERGGFATTGDAEFARRIRAIQADAAFRSEASERACLLRWCYRAALLGNPWLFPRVQAIEAVLRYFRFPGLDDIFNYSQKDYDDELAGRRVNPYPARLPNLMAYAGLLQLRRLEEDLAHRRMLAAFLEERLPSLGARVAQYDHRRVAPSWVRFPFVVEDRAAWAATLRAAHLVPGVWLDDPIHPKGSDWKQAGYVRGSCPNGEFLGEHILNVPVDRRVSIGRLQRWLGMCDHG